MPEISKQMAEWSSPSASASTLDFQDALTRFSEQFSRLGRRLAAQELLDEAPRRSLVLDDGSVVEALIGYRSWRLTFRNGVAQLASLVQAEPWAPGEVFTAICECHKPWRRFQEFNRAHSCGVYAWGGGFRPTWKNVTNPFHQGHLQIPGEVCLWRDIEIHEFGWRAQNAKINALYTGPYLETEMQGAIQLAARQYDVPVVTTDG